MDWELCYINENINDYVFVYYTKRKFVDSYSYGIRSMNGFNMWPPTTYVPPLPPKNMIMPGRPTIRRKKDAIEELDRRGKKKNKKNITKNGTIVRCSLCKARGHNATTCQTSSKKSGTSKSKKRKKTVIEDEYQLFDVEVDMVAEGEEAVPEIEEVEMVAEGEEAVLEFEQV